jgi:hypothetical protein|tara:strand:- start:944 stop:1189 length:246 start_codon:yes stop_codon:yes gene_type:complete
MTKSQSSRQTLKTVIPTEQRDEGSLEISLYARDLALYAAAFQIGTLLKPESMAFVHEWFPVNERTQIGHGVFKTNTKKGTA